MIRLNHAGKVYEWHRFNSDGEGNWFLNHCIVSMELQQVLTRKARKEGLSETSDFARQVTKPAKKKAVRVSSEKRKTRKTRKTKRISDTSVRILIPV